jgi:dihydroflavonol-4-reductase
VSFGVVDVRDVADLHLRAMTNPAAKGERFLATSGVMSLLDGARWLRANMDGVAGKVTTKPFPDWVLRMAALVNPMARQVVGDLGAVRGATNEKARRMLGWQPRTMEEALRASVESLVRLKLLGT